MNFKRKESSERYVVFEMCDNSMTPEIQAGDKIQVDMMSEVINGDLVVADIEDGRTILRKMQKQSDGVYIFTAVNGRYDPIFSERPIIVGRAVRLYREITHHAFIKETESNIAGIIPLPDYTPSTSLFEEGTENE